ncbi:MAG: hypothetical protein KDA24_08515 [Deltaproteobacteria bacterium]|nr:hypothetical protein [Deltaproteobacteria bacterium]
MRRTEQPRFLIIISLFAATLAGCAVSGSDDDDSSEETVSCAFEGWDGPYDEGPPAIELSDGSGFTYQDHTSEEYPKDILGVYVVYAGGASSDPHTFTFEEINYADAHTIVSMSLGCPENGSCDQEFFAASGSLEVTENENGPAAGRFVATMRDIYAPQVTYDNEGNSTVVPDGDCWFIEEHTIDVETVSPF